jgi:adenine deaminase
MESRRPLAFPTPTPITSLALDYGDIAAEEMEQAFVAAEVPHLLEVLNWPGVGTRWREFLEWVHTTAEADEVAAPKAAFRAFGRHLGRVTS